MVRSIMPRLTPVELTDLLIERSRLMRLATVDASGGPYVVPVWFLFEDGRLLVTPRGHSLWWHHIEADPRVCMTVDEERLPYRKAIIQGRVDVVYRPGHDDEWRDLYRRLCLRYWGDAAVTDYIGSTRHVARALVGLHLAAAEVTTWRLPVAGEDTRRVWPRRYDEPLAV
jgi:nitroimidazol reductase NimA-like FMN-containing flavoprotein (pyridoxamine 5'-phosphate oxidase superfamily)